MKKIKVAVTGLGGLIGKGLDSKLLSNFELIDLYHTNPIQQDVEHVQINLKDSEKLLNILDQIKPDAILVLGDRAEMLAGAMVGAYLSIPVAHIHGGENSSTIDVDPDQTTASVSLLDGGEILTLKTNTSQIIDTAFTGSGWFFSASTPRKSAERKKPA